MFTFIYRDAHIGAFSRRGDLEVLGFNMIEWLCGKLPWSSDMPHDKVLKAKQALMSDLNLKKIYPPEIQGILFQMDKNVFKKFEIFY